MRGDFSRLLLSSLMNMYYFEHEKKNAKSQEMLIYSITKCYFVIWIL